MIDDLRGADVMTRRWLVLLLGLIAEAEDPGEDTVVDETIEDGVDVYLELVPVAADDRPLRLALLFLLAHFSAQRERILGAVAAWELDSDELTRLERCLAPTALARGKLGRVWPSPAAWDLSPHEMRQSRTWRESLALTDEDAGVIAAQETRALLAYSGALALDAIMESGDVD